jgi:hypothetical protein
MVAQIAWEPLVYVVLPLLLVGLVGYGSLRQGVREASREHERRRAAHDAVAVQRQWLQREDGRRKKLETGLDTEERERREQHRGLRTDYHDRLTKELHAAILRLERIETRMGLDTDRPPSWDRPAPGG